MQNNRKQGARGVSTGRAPGRHPLSEGSAEDTRKTLLHHAAHLFNERGYASVSLDEIARAAEVNRATLYYHFAGKEDIFLTALERVMTLVCDEIAVIASNKTISVRQRIAHIVKRRTDMMEMDTSKQVDEMESGMVYAAMAHLSPDGRARIGAQFGTVHGLMEGLFAEGIANGELPNISPKLINFVFWQAFPADGFPPELNIPRRDIEAQLLSLIFGITEE